jgi:DNA-binding transcriptional regulator PaaX
MPLSHFDIQNAKPAAKPYKLADGGGLFLLMQPNGMGSGERSVRRYLEELEKAGFLEIRQRGLGKTNLYRLFLTIQKPQKRGHA